LSIALSRFARNRLFGSRPKILGVSADEFEAELNRRNPEEVLPGYAPFCSLHVHRNWTATPCTAVPITPENEHLLRSGYEAREEGELAVLARWFEGEEPPRATWLLPILYTREQMHAEGDPVEADFGVVGCLATMEPREIPMAPITMMRNALGIEEGGSGVALDRQAYAESVRFWSAHANWRNPPTVDTP
jgi:hypothetical protein